MKEPYEKISPTAKFVAYLRTFTDIPFAKEIAEESGAERTYQQLAGESKESLIRFSAYWEARYKATDRIITQRGITQILEVAAGLSPRGLAMTENPDVVYVVTDLPEILDQEKAIAQAILARLNSHRPNLHFKTANALDREGLLRVSTIFGSDRAVAIITEGLLPYLNHEEKTVLARNIHELLSRYRGIWITSDVYTKQHLEATRRLDEKQRERHNRIASSTGSDLESNLFADENDLRSYFDKAGFRIEEYQYSNMIQDLSSPRLLNLNQEDRERVFELLALSKTLILLPRTDGFWVRD
jgi:O-methyltransferase involved in polyketide biosynthesis